jgi:hypothetical protein
MPEPDSRQDLMDGLLRRSLAAPPPRLSADCHARLSHKLRRRSERRSFGPILLGAYGVVSLLVSLVVMRGQGLDWAPIVATTLGALTVAAATRRLVGAGTPVS